MAKKKKDSIKWGPVTFFLGVIIVALVGIMVGMGGQLDLTTITALVILGLIVGFLNISEDEIEKFMIAGITLEISSGGLINILNSAALMNAALKGPLGALAAMLYAIIWFVSPALVIVALKVILDIMQD